MIVHLNGSLVPAADARVSPFDRGFLFGDGIYEGLRAGVINGERRVIGMRRHQRRMADGLRRAAIAFDPAALDQLTANLLDANGLDEAFIYWQVTRGTPDLAGPGPVRSRIPPREIEPTVFGFCTPLPALGSLAGPAVKAATTCLDARWEHGSIKSISLLGNIMAAMHAGARQADETILIRRHSESALVTEGTYTNVVVVTPRPSPEPPLPAPYRDYDVSTPSLSSAPLLAGVTREIVLETERHIRQHAVQSRDLFAASEIILLGTTTMVTSVSTLDGRPVGDGRPGPVARHLFHSLQRAIAEERDDVVGPAARQPSRMTAPAAAI